MSGVLVRVAEAGRRFGTERRPLLLGLAGVVFLVGAWFSAQSIGPQLVDVNWTLIVLVALVGVPVTILLNALEFRAMARLSDLDVSLLEASQIAVMSTAANLLPLPGGVVVRSGHLMSRGVKPSASLKLNLLAGTYSVGISGILMLFLFFNDSVGRLAGALAVVISAAAIATLIRDFRAPWAQFRLLAIEAALILVTAIRGLLIILALGLDADWVVAIGIACVYPIAALIGVFPGGLAIRESLAGLITRSMEGAASIGFLVAAVDRLIGLCVHVPIAFVLTKKQSSTATAGGNVDNNG